jgi:hypothetical protein
MLRNIKRNSAGESRLLVSDKPSINASQRIAVSLPAARLALVEKN